MNSNYSPPVNKIGRLLEASHVVKLSIAPTALDITIVRSTHTDATNARIFFEPVQRLLDKQCTSQMNRQQAIHEYVSANLTSLAKRQRRLMIRDKCPSQTTECPQGIASNHS